MKPKLILITTLIVFLPIVGFAQTPPAPGAPAPPAPPAPPDRHEHGHGPKVPTIFLGVETSEVPSVVSEQLGLAKGFGLVVDYVVPDSPAAGAGLQQNDIIKMLNDQLLINPSQLRKLLQTFPDGTTVTLTILRKGQEQKVTVKLLKKEMPQRHAFLPGFGHDDFDMGEFNEQMQDMKEQLKEQLGAQRGIIRDTVMKARDEARRAVDEARRAAGQIQVRSSRDGGLTTTKIDLGKAQIVFSDDKGEMKLENVDGKKILTAKDPQGKLVFSGPVETKEDVDKLPPDLRQRYQKLEQNDLPEIAPSEPSNQSDQWRADDDEADDGRVDQV